MGDRTILLVEDDPDDRDLILRALGKHKVANQVVAVSDGVEALEYLFATGSFAGRDLSILPAVMLLDLKLPRLSGLDVLRRVREDARTRFLPVVILTSSREEQDLMKGYELGANSYVCKPVDFAEFAEAVRGLNLYWLLLNEPPPCNHSREPRP